MASLAPEVAATRKVERADPTPTIAAGNFETHGGNVPVGSILITEHLVASSAGPLLRLLVEVRLGSTADVGAHRADRGGGRR